jgi:hypothetical protein
MAGEDDKGGGESGYGGYAPPALLPVPAAPSPYGYPGVMLAPSPNAAAPGSQEVKFSETVPAQVRAELPWLVKTAKANKMAAGVSATCYRLLLLILDDLEQAFRPTRPKALGLFPVAYDSVRPLKRIRALRRAGAVTRAVEEEAAILKLVPSSRVTNYASAVGDPQDAARYVAFLRMLVDVAYEARAKYRKNQLPAQKTHSSTSMTVTVGPSSTS